MSVRRIDVKVGFQCNNRCRFCVQGDKRDECDDKSTAELKRILDEGRSEVDEVVFTGGEITLRKDLPELVAHAKGLGFRLIQLQTNGRVLASERALGELVEAGANEIAPAIHGPNEEIHDALTQAKRSFRQTVKGVMNAKKLGVPVVINSVITRANYQHLPEMAQLFVALRADQYQFAFVHPLGTAARHFDEIVPRFGEIEPFVRAGLHVGIRAGVRCMTEAIPLCFLGRLYRHAAEWIIPRTKIFDDDRIVADYTEFRLHEGKLKGPACRGCALEAQCEGPWREYPEHFGWDEFRPLERAP